MFENKRKRQDRSRFDLPFEAKRPNINQVRHSDYQAFLTGNDTGRKI